MRPASRPPALSHARGTSLPPRGILPLLSAFFSNLPSLIAANAQEAPAEAGALGAGEDGLRLLEAVALGPAVLLPDLEVHRDVVAVRGDRLQEVDDVVQGVRVVLALALLLGDRLLGTALLVVEIRDLTLEQRDGGGGLGLEVLELLDRGLIKPDLEKRHQQTQAAAVAFDVSRYHLR